MSRVTKTGVGPAGTPTIASTTTERRSRRWSGFPPFVAEVVQRQRVAGHRRLRSQRLGPSGNSCWPAGLSAGVLNVALALDRPVTADVDRYRTLGTDTSSEAAP